ncbi:MAG: flagellar hook-associated protein FlgL [Bdellovibrionaceae bacterium]|nr:flagellar hook-associated protein FlgL [Bdellovibrio sp.]
MSQNQVLTNIQKNRSELSQLQNQAATMKRITKPSDDPVAASKVLVNRTENKNLEQFEKNIFFARNFLETTETTLSQLSEAVVRAKELAVQAASDTNGGLPREMLSTEVGQIYNAVLEISNRRSGERFLFGGQKTLSQPFTAEGEYSGDDGEIRIENQKGNFVALNLTGDRIFLGKGMGEDSFIKPSRETPKSVDELQQHKLAEADRQFQNEQEDENKLETRGPASVGRVQRLGDVDPVIGGKGVNLFNLISGLEVAMKANDKFGIQDALEPLDQALNQINMARAEIGGRVVQLNAASEGIQRSIVDNKQTISQLEDADLFQVMTDLNRSDAALKGSLETSHKLMSMSLLDFLR